MTASASVFAPVTPELGFKCRLRVQPGSMNQNQDTHCLNVVTDDCVSGDNVYKGQKLTWSLEKKDNGEYVTKAKLTVVVENASGNLVGVIPQSTCFLSDCCPNPINQDIPPSPKTVRSDDTNNSLESSWEQSLDTMWNKPIEYLRSSDSLPSVDTPLDRHPNKSCCNKQNEKDAQNAKKSNSGIHLKLGVLQPSDSLPPLETLSPLEPLIQTGSGAGDTLPPSALTTTHNQGQGQGYIPTLNLTPTQQGQGVDEFFSPFSLPSTRSPFQPPQLGVGAGSDAPPALSFLTPNQNIVDQQIQQGKNQQQIDKEQMKGSGVLIFVELLGCLLAYMCLHCSIFPSHCVLVFQLLQEYILSTYFWIALAVFVVAISAVVGILSAVKPNFSRKLK